MGFHHPGFPLAFLNPLTGRLVDIMFKVSLAVPVKNHLYATMLSENSAQIRHFLLTSHCSYWSVVFVGNCYLWKYPLYLRADVVAIKY